MRLASEHTKAEKSRNRGLLSSHAFLFSHFALSSSSNITPGRNTYSVSNSRWQRSQNVRHSMRSAGKRRPARLFGLGRFGTVAAVEVGLRGGSRARGAHQSSPRGQLCRILTQWWMASSRPRAANYCRSFQQILSVLHFALLSPRSALLFSRPLTSSFCLLAE